MVLGPALLNTQYYMVRIKSKEEQSKEWSAAPPPLHLGVVAIEKGAFGSTSTKVVNVIFLLIFKRQLIMHTRISSVEWRKIWNF